MRSESSSRQRLQEVMFRPAEEISMDDGDVTDVVDAVTDVVVAVVVESTGGGGWGRDDDNASFPWASNGPTPCCWCE